MFMRASCPTPTASRATLAWGLMEGVWYIAYLLFAIVMMFVLNWKLALGVMVIVPVLAVSGVYFQKKLVVYHRQRS